MTAKGATCAQPATSVSGRSRSFETRSRAIPAQGEVAIDVAYTGICGTDLHILHGAMDARVTLPAVLGHEMSGTMSAVGEGVSGGRSATA